MRLAIAFITATINSKSDFEGHNIIERLPCKIIVKYYMHRKKYFMSCSVENFVSIIIATTRSLLIEIMDGFWKANRQPDVRPLT